MYCSFLRNTKVVGLLRWFAGVLKLLLVSICPKMAILVDVPTVPILVFFFDSCESFFPTFLACPTLSLATDERNPRTAMCPVTRDDGSPDHLSWG